MIDVQQYQKERLFIIDVNHLSVINKAIPRR